MFRLLNMISAALVTLGLVVPSLALASTATIIQTRTIQNFPYSVTFDPFDPALGTLSTVRYYGSGSATLSGTATGITNGSGRFSGVAFAFLEWSVGSIQVATNFEPSGFCETAALAECSFDFSETKAVNFNSSVTQDFDLELFIKPATPSVMDLEPLQLFAFSGEQTALNGGFTGQVMLGLEYDFTPAPTAAPVPVPGSLSLLFGGAIALGTVRRRQMTAPR
ncbi:MAG: choice-of-anchor E domain-containing protein [Pseudomonadota bacterium]